jgi:methylmalonyl-CoA mutase C-terminal domain/subunit
MSERKIRVLVAKPGLDGHDRGAKVIAAALQDAGMEVIYTGLHQTPEMIATTALQEDVDVVAMSILSGAHMTLFPRVQQLLQEKGMTDVLITGGGIIPDEDVEKLEALGVGRLFGPGTTTAEAVEFIRDWFEQRAERAGTYGPYADSRADIGISRAVRAGRRVERRPAVAGWRYDYAGRCGGRGRRRSSRARLAACRVEAGAQAGA